MHFSHAFLFSVILSVPMGNVAGAEDATEREGTPWETDFAVAKECAAAQQKDLFLHFTGSDWCGFCIALHDQVLTTPAFLRRAGEHFVLVEIDYPRHKEQSEALKTQNATLRVDFGIKAYPTLLLADRLGRVYASIPNQPGITPEQLVEQMNSRRDVRAMRDERLSAAETLGGLKRAEKLNEALNLMDAEIVERFYPETIDEIISLDEKDTLKLKKNRNFAVAIQDLEREVQELARNGDHDGIASTIDTFVVQKKLKGEQKQRALMLKLGVFGADQLDAALALLDEIVKIKSDTSPGREAAEIHIRLEQYQNERLEAGKVQP